MCYSPLWNGVRRYSLMLQGKNGTVCLDDDEVVGRSMNCNTSVVLEEGEQGSQSVAVIGAPLLAEKDQKVSETAGSGKHFAAYCKGRKRAVQQKIPVAVWKAMYKDFVESTKAQCAATGVVFNEKDLPQERNLQHALPSALGDVSTGTADPEACQKFVPQDNDLMRRLKKTKNFNKKKMSNFREHLANGFLVFDVGTDAEKSASNSRSGSIETKQQRQSKRELMENAVDDVSSMVEVIETKSSDFTRAVQEQTKLQSEDVKNRQDLRELQIKTLQSEEVDTKMKRLIIMRDQQVITEEEFKEKIKAFVHL
ncbi:hypothetical protein BWQ96_07930 [Gracilariopsis chorda]|uniref:Uncharacterized protein n=1 Tax=Gracilariopsis chorda TaxID=448386 RepID=A0A2V3IJU6_9FLOR|nr:hypothetical protein BWQ96_07930 [Gracilariopsis chorda]|eukprot:PXF42341.1 hypothetical protein BWQ96_07930 [Gracilariopsis chorda]